MLLAMILYVILSLTLPLYAALPDYTFTTTTGQYTEITGGTLLGNETSDDQRFVDPAVPLGGTTVMTGVGFPIGFNFAFNDYVFDVIAVCNNGWISFGQSALGATAVNITASSSYNPLSSTSAIAPVQLANRSAAMARDLQAQTGATLRIETIGAAPNRICVIQWKNYKRYGTTGAGDIYNFQIQLYETLNKVDFVYGTVTNNATATTVQVGLRGSDATDFSNRTNTTDWTSTTAGATNAATCALSATIYPPLGITFSFSPQIAVPNDLQAVSITGSTTPSSGTLTPYTISVRNRGSSPQSTYTVKLMSGQTELASVAGPALAAGEITPVVLNYTFTATGDVSLTGKVVLAGDQNPANDVTAPLNIVVQPAGTNLVIIGTGTATQRQPFGVFFGYERDAALYTQNQINAFGLITSVQWYCATISSAAAPFNIYMKTVADAAFTAVPWATMVGDAQLVATGTQTFSQTGWVTFPLTVPYLYSGGNLVVLVETTYGGSGTSPYPYFQYTTGAAGSHQTWYADTTPPAGNGTLGTALPNIGLSLSAVTQLPQFAVSPQTYNFGQVFMNTISNNTFTITNTGGGTTPLIINSIAITGSPFFTLQNLPSLPASLASFQSTTFVARYNPTAIGTHTATITITDNLTRTQHPVTISGTCIDPTIYTPPYVQNFDSVTAPNLPIDWLKLFTSPGNVTTSTTTPHSLPNCVYVYNSTSTSGPFLISPPISANLPLVTMRVKFWAKGATTYTLSVGAIADPTDAATYEQVSSLTLTAAWAEYVVGFQTYAGQGHFIAFKHGNASTSQSIYVDDVTIEVTPQNDLAAMTITGNSTPSVGLASTYTVNLYNWGTNPQSNYTVKLYNGDNLELASAAGPQINAGTSAQATLSWTPTTAGAATIYGKVVLTGDQNNLNDQTPNKSVVVQPAGTMVVTVGDGSQTNYYTPIATFYKASLFENIYYGEELAVGGNITTVAFYYNIVSTTIIDKPIKIWLGTTDLMDLSAGWIPSTSLTLVYDGNISCPAGLNTLTIPLQTPFAYSGGNLVMLVQRVLDTQYFLTTDLFYNQTVGTNRARRVYSDTAVYDPAVPPAGTLTGQFPMTSFFLTPLDPNPHFAISPQSYNYGQALINTTVNKTFTIMNIGGGTVPLVINNIAITGSPFFTLQNVPTLPISLASGQSATFTARYNPTAAGTHTATITVTDNLTNRTAHPVALTATAIDVTIYNLPYAQNFDAVTVPNLPIDWLKVITSPGNVTTVITSPHSTPNCAYIYNSTSTAGPYLIAPPIVATIPMVTTRVKFWAKGATSYSLSVGIIADPADAATYTQVASQTLTATWAEYVVSFQAYAGQGHYMAFKHGNASTSQSIYIDDVVIEVTPQNDLAAISIAGNSTPSVGVASTFTVNLLNWGTNPQSNYAVKLYNGDNLELASVPGPQIDPGLAAQVAVSWTPSIAGDIAIYGKVVLTGDQNSLNDQTPNLNVSVQPAGTIVVTIGEGTSTQRQPIGILYGYERDATLYSTDNIGIMGAITGVRWYCGTTAVGAVPYRILMKNTTATALTATPWATMIADAILMKEGTYTFSQTGWTNFSFETPFVYTGGNLIVLVETNFGGPGTTSPAFRYTTGATGCHQYWYQDTTAPTGNGYLNTNRPNIGISLSAIGDAPVFAVSPQTFNYGQVFINTISNKTFNVINIGGGTNPLIINSITVAGSPFFTLQNLPTLPVSLNGFQATSFVARYNPTAVGTHTATITVTDNLGRSNSFGLASSNRDGGNRVAHPVPLDGTCIDPTIYTPPYTQNFDTVTIPALPIDWSKLITSTATAANVTTVTATPHSVPNTVLMTNSTDANATVILVSPPIATTIPINTMRIKFWAKAIAGYTLNLGILSSPTDAGSFFPTSSVTLTAAWAEYVVAFQTYTGQGHYIGLKHGLGAASRSIYIDDVTIEVTPQNDLAALTITGNTTPSVGMTTNYTVNLFNWGTDPQSDYTVKLYKEGDVEVGSVAGALIAPGASIQAVVPWTPATPGLTYIYGKVVLTGDQNSLNDRTPNLSVGVQPQGVMVVTIGDGSQTARFPIDFYFKNSLNETIYLSSELNVLGQITGISLYNSFFDDRQNMPTKIWMGTTTLADLSAGWIPSTSLTSVFDGTVNYPIGQNTVNITFPQPFLYLEGNLVVMFNRPMDTAFYSSQDYFYCQTVGTNRTRNIYSDSVPYDPSAPPATGGTNTGQFAKTSFYVIPGGVGHLTGNVYGAGNILLSDATIQIVGGGQATTNAQGHYMIQNIVAGTYQVTASRFGYNSQTLTVIIPEDSTVTQNFTLTQMPTVNVTGTIVGSDAPTLGLAGAIINLNGMENYTATTNALGQFTITGVYANQNYTYQASAAGYQIATGSVSVGATNHDMGVVIVNEIAYAPRNMTAAQNAAHSEVTLNWLAPDPNAVDITQGFESTTFPPTDWTRTVTDGNAAGPNGVFPTWCRFGTVVDVTTTVTPPEGQWQCGFWWDYNHQDEWLITPQFNCPQSANLTFDSYVFRGSTNGDHYFVKVTNNNGANWTVLWDASILTGGWNNYQTPVQIDLSAYAGQQIKIAWHADDPSDNQGMWYNWFIDNVIISNTATTLKFNEDVLVTRSAAVKTSQPQVIYSDIPTSRPNSRNSISSDRISNVISANHQTRSHGRSILGYKVWRFIQGQEQNETNWTLLTPEMITTLTHLDTGWAALAPGTYKWVVKALYTGNVISLGVFSNAVTKVQEPTGTLIGSVRNPQNIPINGATITAGAFTTTSMPNGNYSLTLPAAGYTVVCSATNYNPVTQLNIVVNANLPTTLNFTLTPTDNIDEVVVVATALKGNYPNPFNPETTISYDVKVAAPVKIEIYNTKGQLIRTLISEVKGKGHYQIVWNGKDNNGISVASGVYHYRMQAGDYKATRMMMLMK